VVVSTARSVTSRSSATTPVANTRPTERDDTRPLTTVPALGSAISRQLRRCPQGLAATPCTLYALGHGVDRPRLQRRAHRRFALAR
jgi:hypothetical protein